MSDRLLQIAIALLTNEPGARVTIRGGTEMGIRALDHLISLATQAKMRLRGETQNAAVGRTTSAPVGASPNAPAAATPRDGEGQVLDARHAGPLQIAPPSPPNRSVQGHTSSADKAKPHVPAAAAPKRDGEGQLRCVRATDQALPAPPSRSLSAAGRAMRDQLERRAVAPVLLRLSDGSDLATYTYGAVLAKRRQTRWDAFLLDCVLAVGTPINKETGAPDMGARVKDYVTSKMLETIAARAKREALPHAD